MATVIVPIGFVAKWWEKGKFGMITGMFWRIGEETKFLCDECSLKELKATEPPLKKIDEGLV